MQNALADTGAAVARIGEPRTAPACAGEEIENERRLLVGPRIIGRSADPVARNARAVSAAMLLDPAIERDDRRLFAGRVVLIGATHSGAGDFWLTPGGVLPGVEVLANTVYYSPLDTGNGIGSEIAYRGLTILLFAIFVAATCWLRGIVAFFAGVFAALLVVAFAIGGWDYFRVFESLESAIWLAVLCFALQATLDLVEDLRWRWKSFARSAPPAGTRRRPSPAHNDPPVRRPRDTPRSAALGR